MPTVIVKGGKKDSRVFDRRVTISMLNCELM